MDSVGDYPTIGDAAATDTGFFPEFGEAQVTVREGRTGLGTYYTLAGPAQLERTLYRELGQGKALHTIRFGQMRLTMLWHG